MRNKLPVLQSKYVQMLTFVCYSNSRVQTVENCGRSRCKDEQMLQHAELPLTYALFLTGMLGHFLCVSLCPTGVLHHVGLDRASVRGNRRRQGVSMWQLFASALY